MPEVSQTCFPRAFELQKTYKNLRFFNVFCNPAHVAKSSLNAPRGTPKPRKLSSKSQSWHYHCPSWRLRGSTWHHNGPSSAHLAANFAHLARILAPISAEAAAKSRHNPRQPPQEPPKIALNLDFPAQDVSNILSKTLEYSKVLEYSANVGIFQDLGLFQDPTIF